MTILFPLFSFLFPLSSFHFPLSSFLFFTYISLLCLKNHQAAPETPTEMMSAQKKP